MFAGYGRSATVAVAGSGHVLFLSVVRQPLSLAVATFFCFLSPRLEEGFRPVKYSVVSQALDEANNELDGSLLVLSLLFLCPFCGCYRNFGWWWICRTFRGFWVGIVGRRRLGLFEVVPFWWTLWWYPTLVESGYLNWWCD